MRNCSRIFIFIKLLAVIITDYGAFGESHSSWHTNNKASIESSRPSVCRITTVAKRNNSRLLNCEGRKSLVSTRNGCGVTKGPSAFVDDINARLRGGSDESGNYGNNNGRNYNDYNDNSYRDQPSGNKRSGNDYDAYGDGAYEEDQDRGYMRNDGYYNNRNDGDRGDYYDDQNRRETRGTRKTESKPSSGISDITSQMNTLRTKGNRKFGIILTASGIVISLLGISMFFNKTLLRFGNLCFICGIPLLIGPSRTASFFLQPKKARATGCLAFGIFLVLIGKPFFGMILEIFGFLNLFGNLFPVVLAMLKNMPFVGELFKGRPNADKKKKTRRREEAEYSDRYYPDERKEYNGYDEEERYY